MPLKRMSENKEYIKYNEIQPDEEYLVCNHCGRYCFVLRYQGYECGMLIGNVHCSGELVPSEEAPAKFTTKVPDPHLICDKCGRRADLLDMQDKSCNWRFGDRNYCGGILRRVD